MATTNLGLTLINQSDNISPTPINDNMEMLDNLGIDYIVSTGTSGIWTYRRWKSGIYECWGRYTEQTPGGKIENATAAFIANFPVSFSNIPVVLITARQDGNNGVHVGYVEHGQTRVTWYLLGMTGYDIECNLYAIGTVS